MYSTYSELVRLVYAVHFPVESIAWRHGYLQSGSERCQSLYRLGSTTTAQFVKEAKELQYVV